MDYASIESGASHRQSKKFKQRLKYRLDQGYSYEEAFELASRKLSLLPTQGQTPDAVNSVNPSKHEVRKFRLVHSPDVASPSDEKSSAQSIVNFRPSEESSAPDEKSSMTLNPLPEEVSREPSDEEVRSLVEYLKTKNLMTEIPSRPKIVSEVGPIGNFIPNTEEKKSSIRESKSDWMLWLVAGMASAWLAHAMLESLPDSFILNLLVAISFAFAPMLILATKLRENDRKIARLGALAIFLLDVLLYLVPSTQVLWNESSSYLAARDSYDLASLQYENKARNDAALIASAKSLSEASEASYQEALRSYGANSWRTATAKKDFDQKHKEWNEKSKALESVKAPESPKLSHAVTEALQALTMRVGLFLVVYFLMFARTKRI